MSMLKMGRSAVIPKQVTKAVVIHKTMMQVAVAGGEASGNSMRTVIKATTNGTDK